MLIFHGFGSRFPVLVPHPLLFLPPIHLLLLLRRYYLTALTASPQHKPAQMYPPAFDMLSREKPRGSMSPSEIPCGSEADLCVYTSLPCLALSLLNQPMCLSQTSLMEMRARAMCLSRASVGALVALAQCTVCPVDTFRSQSSHLLL